jgi:histidinol dehydrogenase
VKQVAVIRDALEVERFLRKLENRLPGEDPAVHAQVSSIIASVRDGGIAQVLRLRERFEAVPSTSPLVLNPRIDGKDGFSFAAIAERLPQALRQALIQSADRVRRYHEIQQESDRSLSEPSRINQHGASATSAPQGDPLVGHFVSRVQPLDSVAVYVPGGKAFYPSSVIMSAVPAQVAGVKRISVVTPYRSLENPAFAATVLALGIDEVLVTGGAQGVATAAFGIEGFRRCDKIVGPGNSYVATAKHLLAGRIGVDNFAGPSEILVLGDGSSPPDWIAADLLAQAEHDQEASAVLVTTSEAEAVAVAAALEAAFGQLGDRADVARSSWDQYGAIILVSSREQQIALANTIHAEHLHIHTSDALEASGRQLWSNSLRGVGAVFFGRYTAEVFGDYIAGPSHVLPTAGTARFASPLGVYDFIRRSSLLWMSPELASELAEPTGVFADAEELWGHARAARLRRGTN